MLVKQPQVRQEVVDCSSPKASYPSALRQISKHKTRVLRTDCPRGEVKERHTPVDKPHRELLYQRNSIDGVVQVVAEIEELWSWWRGRMRLAAGGFRGGAVSALVIWT